MRTHTGKFTGRTATGHHRPSGIAEVRARLTGLQLNPRLAPFARREIEEADRAIVRAERAQPDSDGVEELVSTARLKVEHALELARARYRTALSSDAGRGTQH